MSSTQVPGVPGDITLMMGPLLLGYLFNWGLFGILSLQIYIYYLSFPQDSTLIKSLVYGLYILDVIQTALTTHNAWHFLSAGWGDLSVLDDPGWSWIAVPLFSGLVSATVQLFFAWRIWKLSGLWWLSGLIACLALAQGISGIVSGIWFAILNDITKISLLDASATVWLGGSALTDFMITVSLVWVLQKKARNVFSETEDVISRIIRMTVQTGAVTTFAATAELILYLKSPQNNLHMIPALALAKLYTNTLVATLNSRSDTFHSSNRTRSLPTIEEGMNRGQKRTTQGRIQVTTVRETVQDDVAMVNLPNKPHKRPTLDADDEFDNISASDDNKGFSYSHSSLAAERGRVVDIEKGEL